MGKPCGSSYRAGRGNRKHLVTDLAGKLNTLARDFAELPVAERLNLLLEFSESLPVIPERLQNHPDLLERVVECQSPVFLTVEVDQGIAHLFITAPRESPTTRGFASILHYLLDGLTVEQVLAASDDIPDSLSLSEAVSPLRIRGMRGMFARIKRQVSEKSVAS
jgi:cysteine desulfuration protein SufE